MLTKGGAKRFVSFFVMLRNVKYLRFLFSLYIKENHDVAKAPTRGRLVHADSSQTLQVQLAEHAAHEVLHDGP